MIVVFFDWRNDYMNDKDFIKQLKEKRDRYAVSQTKLAVAVGIIREYLNRIENGKTKPTEHLKQELCHDIPR